MSRPHFPDVEKICHAPAGDSKNPDDLSFRWYDPERRVLGKRMEDLLRVSVCFWHSFGFDGTDMFGGSTFARGWQDPSTAPDPMKEAALRLEAAFEFFQKLGAPFFCFHDADVAPGGDSLAASNDNLDRIAELIEGHMQHTGVRLLWGTANLFSHPRYAAGAATNPDPDVFAYAAGQVKHALEVTARLGGSNYVLWGGREGYDTLLNTDMRRESAQLGRFMQLVVEHKHKIGFEGTILIEPKPHEPSKHQYDHDAATVHAFLLRHGLEREIKLNIEVNHATLAGHSFQHELAYAAANDLLGSVDANRGDPQNGWDTDQFPNSAEELTGALFEILRAGGLGNGGFNFDAKLRRQSIDPIDLFHAHVGGMDALARGLLGAAQLIEAGQLQRFVDQRYAGWDSELGRQILSGKTDLGQLASHVQSNNIAPEPRSGRQEMLENLVSQAVA
jgi:xylose isomerase